MQTLNMKKLLSTNFSNAIPIEYRIHICEEDWRMYLLNCCVNNNNDNSRYVVGVFLLLVLVIDYKENLKTFGW